MLVTGIMAFRILMGRYPWAYWIAWPASWAATPMAAVEVRSQTLSESRMILVLGS